MESMNGHHIQINKFENLNFRLTMITEESDNFYEVAIARRLAIAKTREKCYCQTSGNSTKLGKMLLPGVW